MGMNTALHATAEDLSNLKSYAKPLMEKGNGEVVAVLLERSTKGVSRRSGQEDVIHELLDMGVEIRVCENSMEENNVDESELVNGVETVPAGPVELSKLHDEGYGYIKL